MSDGLVHQVTAIGSKTATSPAAPQPRADVDGRGRYFLALSRSGTPDPLNARSASPAIQPLRRASLRLPVDTCTRGRSSCAGAGGACTPNLLQPVGFTTGLRRSVAPRGASPLGTGVGVVSVPAGVLVTSAQRALLGGDLLYLGVASLALPRLAALAAALPRSRPDAHESSSFRVENTVNAPGRWLSMFRTRGLGTQASGRGTTDFGTRIWRRVCCHGVTWDVPAAGGTVVATTSAR
jgi:hypothetical protein